MENQGHSRRVRLFAIFTTMFVGASLMGLFAAPAQAGAGVTKLLKNGTEVSYNSPHLDGCAFTIQWSNFSASTVIDYTFQGQNPTPGGTFISGSVTTDNDGYATAPVSFTPVNLAGMTPSGQGYHVTLFGDSADTGTNAKNKTFWIETACGTDEEPVYVCENLDGGPYTEVPDGYHEDENGDCVQDEEPVYVCENLDGGPYTEVPDGYHEDENGDCVQDREPTDVCPNIAGDQSSVPAGMHKNSDGDCVKDEIVLATQTHDAKPDKKPQVVAAAAQPDADNELPFTGNDQAPYTALGSLLLLSGLGFLYLHHKGEQLAL